MRRRRNADEVARLLREADRDLAKGLTISDICRKQGIAETTDYRWRQRHAPGQVDNDRWCRELELEVDRLKRLVAELHLDKTMLQDIAKKKWLARTNSGPPPITSTRSTAYPSGESAALWAGPVRACVTAGSGGMTNRP
jgi:putative transposase